MRRKHADPVHTRLSHQRPSCSWQARGRLSSRLRPCAGPGLSSVSLTSLFPSPAIDRISGESFINTCFLQTFGQNYVEEHKELMGHADLATTQIYRRSRDERKRQAVDAMSYGRPAEADDQDRVAQL
jgi:hypothetical protein